MSLPNEARRIRPRTNRRAFVAILLSLAACVQPCAWFAARHDWKFDALTHLRSAGCFGLAVAGTAWLFARRRLVAATFFVAATIHALQFFQFNTASNVRPDPDSPRRLKIAVANVLNVNLTHDPMIVWLDREDPDVVALIEVSREWIDALEASGIRKRYPYRVELPGGGWGMALWSKEKPHRIEPPQSFYPRGNPVLKMTMTLGEGITTLWVVHPPNPIGPAREWASRELIAIADQIGLRGGSQIVVGDLNRTENSPFFADFLATTNLRDGRQGFGIQPTWPTWSPFRIALDHAFVSDDVAVIDRRVGPDIGSDHYPFIIELGPAAPSNSRK